MAVKTIDAFWRISATQTDRRTTGAAAARPEAARTRETGKGMTRGSVGMLAEGAVQARLIAVQNSSHAKADQGKKNMRASFRRSTHLVPTYTTWQTN